MDLAELNGASIADIARECGTSTATVSRVLNGKPDVGPETRRRILAALKAREYRPRIGRVAYDSIGVCLPPGRRFTYFYLTELLEALAQAAAARGCTLTLLPAQLVEQPAANLDALVRRQRLAGLLFVGAAADADLAAARESHLPYVVIDPPRPRSAAVAVGTDVAGGIAQAVEHLHRLGHRRIVLLNGPESEGRDWQRLAGLRDAFGRLGLPFGDEAVMAVERPEAYRPAGPAVWQAVERLLARVPAPTALIGGGEWITLPALLALASHGVRLPYDLSFVAFHDGPSAQYSHPPLTAIRQHTPELAQLAVDLLVQLVRGEQAMDGGKQSIPMELVVRESSGLAPDTETALPHGVGASRQGQTAAV